MVRVEFDEKRNPSRKQDLFFSWIRSLTDGESRSFGKSGFAIHCMYRLLKEKT
jgi:hypothetical protein